jgi:hypothetical protein
MTIPLARRPDFSEIAIVDLASSSAVDGTFPVASIP